MKYDFQQIEQKWQHYWEENKTFKANNHSNLPKYYVLDMFPYPSGAGLHVGHPLGYIASDIYAKYKLLKGFNVLHPMGFDAFGLPAEQYAIQTGQHPAITTQKNIERYKQQLKKIGLGYDWDREINTSDPNYYKWTQWLFIQLFNSWYNNATQKAEPITTLIDYFSKNGNQDIDAATSYTNKFDANQWHNFSKAQQSEILLNYRLAYLSKAVVNYCPALGTVLANDEVKDGLSVRGGHPVEKRTMQQWFLRITAYADRLLQDLENLDWTDAMKEMQRNWIGKSYGAEINFKIQNSNQQLTIFTTRPDTIFGVSFMAIAPEHDLALTLATAENLQAVETYINTAKNKSERERLAENNKLTGVFTGSFAIHPFTQQLVPIWVADYVLSGYGTGAVMAVPASDSRDYAFAKHYNLPIIEVVSGGNIAEAANESKEGTMLNSDFLNGLTVKEAIQKAIEVIEEKQIGCRKVNYRLRDAGFSRQRYWGEPFPIVYNNNIPEPLPIEELPLILPDVKSFEPTGTGESPLAALKEWVNLPNNKKRETDTMPAFAGSSWYFLRYMDANNDKAFVDKDIQNYWQNVDLYIGGTEHAVGHLLYARFFQKVFYDLGYLSQNEPFKKLINQGMIGGRSNFVYRINGTNTFVSYNLKNQYQTTPIHVDVNIVDNDILDTESFKQWQPEYHNAEFILEDGKYICGYEFEKMSKSKFNVVNPDTIIEKYGADTFRLYEMFLGPLEQHKPWSTKGIEGVARFLKKFWRLFFDDNGTWLVTQEKATAQELKILHRSIKKITEDMANFSFNTSVSTFMIAVNELTDLNCHKQSILQELLIIMAPFAPHITEELWQQLGNTQSIFKAEFPCFNEAFLVENTTKYPISFNGKTRFFVELDNNLSAEQIEKFVLQQAETQKYLNGKPPKKVIVVPNKIVNIVF